LRQADFSEHGITQSQLSLIEKGDLEPSAAKIDVLASVLNLAPRDLIADTELEGRYDASQSLDRRKAHAAQTARLARSQRLVAAAEAYQRIQRFCERFCAVGTEQSTSIDADAHYQFAVRIYRRAIDEAKEFDRMLAENVFLIPSIIGELRIDNVSLQTMLQRSQAYLTSLLLEYPEADNADARREIVTQIGLEPIDRYLGRHLH
jgi:transcriptional regulator with XRE-family HTH domain